MSEALPRPDLANIAKQVVFEEWERLLQGESDVLLLDLCTGDLVYGECMYLV